MSRIIEFSMNHYILVGIFIFLFIGFIFIEMQRKGSSVSNNQLSFMLNNETAIALDIRSHKDFSEGHITSSLNIPFDKLNERFVELDKYKEKIIIIIDSIGQHSGSAAVLLREKGFNICRLDGGIANWQYDRLPIIKS